MHEIALLLYLQQLPQTCSIGDAMEVVHRYPAIVNSARKLESFQQLLLRPIVDSVLDIVVDITWESK